MQIARYKHIVTAVFAKWTRLGQRSQTGVQNMLEVHHYHTHIDPLMREQLKRKSFLSLS